MAKRMTPKLLQAFADQSQSYESSSADGRLHLVCPQCRALVLLLESRCRRRVGWKLGWRSLRGESTSNHPALKRRTGDHAVTSTTTELDSLQPASEKAVDLFDNWFDPIDR
jgi:hypothetical protein